MTIDPNHPPPGIWLEEQRRGNTDILIVMRSAFPIGFIEVGSYEEKVQWQTAVDHMNSISKPS